MKLPMPREKLVEQIRFGLQRGGVPIRIIALIGDLKRDRGIRDTSRNDDWLDALSDKDLVRLFIETAELRLNPTNSTDFTEPGISPAERRERIVEFVVSVPQSQHGQLAVDAIEKAFLIADQLGASSESEKEWKLVADRFIQAWKVHNDGQRQRRARGGKAKAANNPKQSAAREAIRAEFSRWQAGVARYTNDADFARKMHVRHADAYTNEGSIKNAIGRWRKES